ncbi:hypothetical protein QJS10_CPB14g00669 [Acorus calamus]|uniref:PWI domain-containing protein n=1 Tax=Acorus calamus TaxID=4465 RepID=A0AAV9DEV4_ACOCL|nr:hypothetical protein QJS10_CPB14g00669 [Acorus calamus]
MSGGFFRGTSFDQDTRFSNKQAKLLKSQKFAPELDHLIDTTKVKMDVIRPWIATRATELLGFEDEVLINFVYGLLDGKEVDGKHIQIQLTGFMEKNTGKFMKELWGLLISAQNNVSGVPQQFLDAKEEETKKKNAETNRIAQEIQKRREKEARETEEKNKPLDGEVGAPRSSKFSLSSEAVDKHPTLRASSERPKEDREVEKHGARRKNKYSKSPVSNGHSQSPHRRSPSAVRSGSRSFSNSRSYSEEGSHKSRSISRSPRPRRHAVSNERRYRSPPRRSPTPEKRYRSPPRRAISSERRYRSPPRRSVSPRRRRSPRNIRSPSRRSPHLRRRSPPFTRRRSPTPVRYRSPIRRRSPSPLRHRSPSPLRRRSPVSFRRRSPSPSWHRSPVLVRRRSPSPPRRRSPVPVRRRSISPRHRSPSPVWRRSPTPPRRRSPPPRSPKHLRSPVLSPRRRTMDSQMSPQQRNRSHSPPSHFHRSLSKDQDSRLNDVESRRYQDDSTSHKTHNKRSPGRNVLESEEAKIAGRGQRKPEYVLSQTTKSLRSPQQDPKDKRAVHSRKSTMSTMQEKSPTHSESPPRVRKMKPGDSMRSPSSSESSVKENNARITRHDSPKTSREDDGNSHAREVISLRDGFPDSLTPEASILQEDIEYGPKKMVGESFSQDDARDKQKSDKLHVRGPSSPSNENLQINSKHHYVDEKKRSRSQNELDGYKIEREYKSSRKDTITKVNALGSDSEGHDSHKYQNLKGKHRSPDSQGISSDNDSGSGSEIDRRKEAKRRRKDEKRSRKERRKRRKHEERHRRREECYAAKSKAKSLDIVNSPSGSEKDYDDAEDSGGDFPSRRGSRPTDMEGTASEQKKLEIELRNKALESLRAKKGISQ